jgi:hypothetical protein
VQQKASLLDQLVGAGEQRFWHGEAIAFAVLRLITSSNFVGFSIGSSPGLASFEDFVYKRGRATVEIGPVRPVWATYPSSGPSDR